MGVFEMKPYLVREDIDQWLPLLGWLAKKEGTTTGIAPGQPLPSIPTITTPSIPVESASDWEFLTRGS
jgi:hypothetical protein